MDDNFKAVRELVPFTYIVKRNLAVEDDELTCPINDMLEMAISSKMTEITAMGMIYVESSELFPSISVKPTNRFEFEGESKELGQWIEKTLRDIPPDINSFYFTYCEDESRGDEDSKTFSINLFGADTFDDYFEWIWKARGLTDYTFQSKTLDELYKIRTELNWEFGKIAFLEKIILYSYGVLLVAKACSALGLKIRSRHNKNGINIVFGVETGSALIPYQALDLTDLL